MAAVKQQHYLPQFYLGSFVDERDDGGRWVWVLPKQSCI